LNHKYIDYDFKKILRDRLISGIYVITIATIGIIAITAIILLRILHIFKPLVVLDALIYSMIIGVFTWLIIFSAKKIKYAKLYEVAKEIYIYDDRLEFITPAGLKMVAKFEWIGLIDAIEEDLYALIFYYDENLRRCNYLYLSNDLVPHIVAQYKKWVERTGRKPCYIVIGKVSKKEAQKSMVILRRLEKSRFCKGARYLWR